jgi:hypothetical protein
LGKSLEHIAFRPRAATAVRLRRLDQTRDLAFKCIQLSQFRADRREMGLCQVTGLEAGAVVILLLDRFGTLKVLFLVDEPFCGWSLGAGVGQHAA